MPDEYIKGERAHPPGTISLAGGLVALDSPNMKVGRSQRLPRVNCKRLLLIPILLAVLADSVASADTPAPLACAVNIKALDGAKQQLQIEHKLKPGDPVTSAMLTPYFKGGTLPQCPTGGKYMIGAIGERPACSLPAHSESEVLRILAQQRQQQRSTKLLLLGRLILFAVAAPGVVMVAWRLTKRSENNH